MITLAFITLASILILFVSAVPYFRSEERSEANARLSLYGRSLNAALQRFQHLPYVLARDSIVIGVAEQSQNADLLNVRFEEFAREAALEAIYLMDEQGDVLAASNYRQAQSFVGNNYGFRPYFLSSAEGKRGEFFGVGATTGRPGYFVSEPVFDYEGDFIGVIAVKLDMSELQATWEAAGEKVFVSNSDGVVVLSSKREWLFKLLNPLNGTQISNIERNRQFGDLSLTPLDWQHDQAAEATIEGNRFIYVSRAADRLNWTVHYLLSEGRIYERATLTTAIFGSGIICLVLFSTFLRSRRISTALMISQNDREQLRRANEDLETAQAELKKTSKLAALGQLSASVTHELGQPISALRNYLTAAELNGDLANERSRDKLFRVADRMDNITKQLRFFIRSDDDDFKEVDLNRIVKAALELLDHKFRAEEIELSLELDVHLPKIQGNALRLEQVIVNLINNSIGAVRDQDSAQINITSEVHDQDVYLHVDDNGTGFGERSIDMMIEPFHTTKASGDGMGLGLSIASEIVREHSGKLAAENRDEGGSRFSVSLPISRHSATT